MKNKLPAFTLIEIIVVLVIFSSILGLGLVAFTSYSRTSVLTEATGDVVAVLKETQNMAKNNSIPKPTGTPGQDNLDSIYYYLLEITNTPGSSPRGVINRYLYTRVNNGISYSFGNVLDTETAIQSKLIGSVTYGSGSATQPICVLFEALTGKIWVMQASPTCDTQAIVNQVFTNGTTQLTVKVNIPNNTLFKTVYINPVEGNFGVLGE